MDHSWVDPLDYVKDVEKVDCLDWQRVDLRASKTGVRMGYQSVDLWDIEWVHWRGHWRVLWMESLRVACWALQTENKWAMMRAVHEAVSMVGMKVC